MRIIHLKLLWFLLLMACTSQDQEEAVEVRTEAEASSIYNALKAQEFGADDYGMKKYVMAFLKRGPNRDLSAEAAAVLQKAHLENIGRLAEEGKLSLAGPFLDDGDIRGIYIFNVESIEEAKALTQTDPAIKAGSLTMELKPWYGSAALVGINEMHKSLQKQSIVE